MSLKRAAFLSAASGCAWGAIGYLPAGRAVIMQSAVGFLWGLTFMGYILVLWPLSYLNCWLIWKQADARNEPIESGGDP